MPGITKAALPFLALAFLSGLPARSACAQDLTTPPKHSLEPSIEKLQQQIKNLSSPSYRTRQLAIWYLEQNPKRALPLLRAAAKTTDLNMGAEIVGMLCDQAMETDASVSVEAHEALKEIAGGNQSVTAVSHLAIDALAGIAERQRVLAEQALEELNVRIGPLRLNVNGATQNENTLNSIILHVDDDFLGKDQHLRLFRFLRSVDTAYLEGTAVSEKMLHEVLAMPGLRRLVLKGDKVNNDLLQAIFDLEELEHLELAYAPLDEQALETIMDLPLVGSLRIFGTKLSPDAATRLKENLDGLEVYIARGGFLGVQTFQGDLKVNKVVRDSAAEKGGIRDDDIITHVNQKPVKIFDHLRAELAAFAPGEEVEIEVDRRTGDIERPLEHLKLKIILGIQESESN